jgi:hypothetical protein
LSRLSLDGNFDNPGRFGSAQYREHAHCPLLSFGLNAMSFALTAVPLNKGKSSAD